MIKYHNPTVIMEEFIWTYGSREIRILLGWEVTQKAAGVVAAGPVATGAGG